MGMCRDCPVVEYLTPYADLLEFVLHTHTHTHTCTHAHTHTRTHTRMHAHTRTHTHTQCMLNVGRVIGINQHGDAVVSYQNRSKWTLNPAVLSKVFVEQPTVKEEGSPHGLNVGDFVKISGDVRKVKALQKGHGEWVDSMSQVR